MVTPKYKFASIGKDVVIRDGARIERPKLVSIGNRVAIDECVITTALELGDYIHVGPYVSIIGGVNGLLRCAGFNNIMSGARIITISDRFDGSGLFGAMIPEKYRGNLVEGTVTLDLFANVGTNAVVLPGTHLAMGVLVAVGSVIRGETQPWTKYSGNPAMPYAEVDGAKALEYARELGYDV